MLTSSGQAANFYAVFNIATCGDHVVSASTIYGGTINGGYAGNANTDAVAGGGAIYIDGNGSSALSTLTIKGNVTISGGEAAAYGGNILANNTTTTLEGNVVVEGGNALTGGNIRVTKAGVMDIKAGVVVKDGEATEGLRP